jgi:hypothetical protein
MKLRKQKSSKKVLIIGAAILLVSVGAGAWYLTRNQNSSISAAPTAAPTNTVNYGPPTEQEQASQNQQKDDFLNNTTGDGSTPANQPSPDVSISITRAGQTGAGQAVNVRTIVSGTTSGTCDMVFTKGSTNVTKSYPISVTATSAVCNADIDIASFNESGSWNLSVVAKNGSKTSAPAVWSLTINK